MIFKIVKPVYNGHSILYEQLSFIYRLKIYALFLNVLYRQCYIEEPCKAGLIVYLSIHRRKCQSVKHFLA